MVSTIGISNKHSSGMTKKLINVLIAGTILLASLLVPAERASASAYGCAFGNPSWGPTHYCVNLNGSGTYVNYVSGSFGGSGLACDAKITAEFFDTSWRWYETKHSSTKWGCATAGSNSIGIYAHKKRGFMCSTLTYKPAPSMAQRRMSVCHQIK